MKIDFIVPKCWEELTDEQLLYVYRLISCEVVGEELCVTCLLHFSGTKVIGRQPGKVYLLQHGKTLFDVDPVAIAELSLEMKWICNYPTAPVRISAIGKSNALPADFLGVPFETFLICDNLFQGFLQTEKDELLEELAAVLYPGLKKISPEVRICVFFWFASLKEFFSNRFNDFFQPVGGDGNKLGSPEKGRMFQDAMDAQIRALTKGDITKEAEILSLDTWRALTELNAQAREYKNLQAQMKK